MNTTTLIQQYIFFLENQSTLSTKYPDYYLLIQNQAVQGAFLTGDEARTYAASRFIEGTYLVQYCSPFKSGYNKTSKGIELNSVTQTSR